MIRGCRKPKQLRFKFWIQGTPDGVFFYLQGFISGSPLHPDELFALKMF